MGRTANMFRSWVAGLLVLAALAVSGAPAFASLMPMRQHAEPFGVARVGPAIGGRDTAHGPQTTSQHDEHRTCSDQGAILGAGCCSMAPCFMMCGGLPATAASPLLPRPQGSAALVVEPPTPAGIDTLPALPPPRPSV
jgi:hypothetical protein